MNPLYICSALMGLVFVVFAIEMERGLK